LITDTILISEKHGNYSGGHGVLHFTFRTLIDTIPFLSFPFPQPQPYDDFSSSSPHDFSRRERKSSHSAPRTHPNSPHRSTYRAQSPGFASISGRPRLEHRSITDVSAPRRLRDSASSPRRFHSHNSFQSELLPSITTLKDRALAFRPLPDLPDATYGELHENLSADRDRHTEELNLDELPGLAKAIKHVDDWRKTALYLYSLYDETTEIKREAKDIRDNDGFQLEEAKENE
jgi:hypothetical protein